MAASMWGNNIKRQCLKIRRFERVCRMEIVAHIQKLKLIKSRNTYNISTTISGVLESEYNLFINGVLLPLQTVNIRHTGQNSERKLPNGPLSVSSQTLGAVKSYLISDSTRVGSQKRWYSSDAPHSNKFQLMDFPPIVWPSPLKTIKNWILSRFIITPYFDREFSIAEFAEGSKQAVEAVSRRLADADFEGLEDLVAPAALRELRASVSHFSLQQRLELAVSAEDMYFCFPHQVGVMFDDKDQRRYVEITMCYHVLRGLKELREQNVNPPLNMGLLPEYQDKLFICNYRFVREYTRGVADQWTVNVANHFRPGETLS
ncbi:m-AAA protease-interacting protein 1, mitochondrial [Bacillus rossius redtenbacheri]|uniref:m-AAA protease-interacting protein 1, mitochondrial n=1 Tax=Bacillus rossius redtenbacheri TaxID=93214 RepID=UPI002FDEB9B1